MVFPAAGPLHARRVGDRMMMMMMMCLLAAALVVPPPAAAARTKPPGNSNEGRKNVLFLMSDDLRPELGSFGASYVHSPNIDALAQRSLVLAANYVQQAVCGPTRASLLTGRRPNTLRTVTHTSPTCENGCGPAVWLILCGRLMSLAGRAIVVASREWTHSTAPLPCLLPA
eukprot:COSAG01_NODE_11160_length_1991_cov_1.678986_3_plen_171_part_00